MVSMYWSGSGYPTEQSSSDQEPSEIVAVEVTPRPMMLRGPRLPLFDEAKKKAVRSEQTVESGIFVYRASRSPVGKFG